MLAVGRVKRAGILMLSRKLQTAVFAATLSSFLMAVVFPLNTSGFEDPDRYKFVYMLSGFRIYTPFIFLGTFLFGVPVSMTADRISGRVGWYPSLLSYGLHILACALFAGLFMVSCIVATVFFILDRWLKGKNFPGSATALFFIMLLLWTFSIPL